MATNRAFGNNIIFLQQFFSISEGDVPCVPPMAAPMILECVPCTSMSTQQNGHTHLPNTPSELLTNSSPIPIHWPRQSVEQREHLLPCHEMGNNCCRKRSLLPKTIFSVTTFKKHSYKFPFLLNFYQRFLGFLQEYPRICIFRPSSRKTLQVF